jgi:hypothetical protein
MITNPPFKLAEEFIKHARTLELEKFALFAKLAFLEGARRSRLLESSGLSRVWVFRERVTLTRNGEPSRNSGMIAFAWYVWDAWDFGNPPTIGWISTKGN